MIKAYKEPWIEEDTKDVLEITGWFVFMSILTILAAVGLPFYSTYKVIKEKYDNRKQ